MAVIFCMGCGQPLEEGVKFCPACGTPTRLGAGLSSPVEPQVPVAPTPERSPRTTARPYTSVPATAPDRSPEPTSSVSPLDKLVALPRPALLGIAAAVLALVVVLGAGFASGLLGGRSSEEAMPAGTGEIDMGGSVSDDPVGSAGIAVRETLADYSWQELSIIGKEMTRRGTKNDALTIAHEYHLVDDLGRMTQVTKNVTVTGLGTMRVRLADVYHDTLANGEGMAGLSFISVDATLTHMMKANDDNIGGWEASQMRSWLGSEVLTKLDGELASVLVDVDKHTNNVGAATSTDAVTSTIDKLWIPSVVEVCGQVEWVWDSDAANSGAYNAVLGAEGFQYACFAEMGINSTENNAGLVLQGSNGALAWWLRSSSASKAAHYRMVDEAGNPSRWGEGPSELGVCLGFCL